MPNAISFQFQPLFLILFNMLFILSIVNYVDLIFSVLIGRGCLLV